MPLMQVLRRFDVIVYRDLDPGVDRRQVPAAGARLDFYQQGATARTPTETIPPTTARSIGVWYQGTIVVGDQLQVGPATNDLLLVEQIVLPVGGQLLSSLVLRNNGASPVTVDPGDRLLRLNERPIAQQDPTGAAVSGDPFVDADAMGRAACYLRPFLFDVMLSGNDMTPKVFPDCEGSFVIRT
jgi:hypothetical protein